MVASDSALLAFHFLAGQFEDFIETPAAVEVRGVIEVETTL